MPGLSVATTKNSNYCNLLGRVVCLRLSRDLTVCVVVSPCLGLLFPRTRAAGRVEEAGWARASSALPGNWPLAVLSALLPGLGQAQLVSGAVLVRWPGAPRKKDVCECVGGQAAGNPPPKFGFPGPSRRSSTQISLHGTPPNLAFDSVSRGPKTGVEGS